MLARSVSFNYKSCCMPQLIKRQTDERSQGHTSRRTALAASRRVPASKQSTLQADRRRFCSGWKARLVSVRHLAQEAASIASRAPKKEEIKKDTKRRNKKAKRNGRLYSPEDLESPRSPLAEKRLCAFSAGTGNRTQVFTATT